MDSSISGKNVLGRRVAIQTLTETSTRHAPRMVKRADSAPRRRWAYPSATRATALATVEAMRPGFWSRSKYRQASGVTSILTRYPANIADTTVRASGPNSFLASPERSVTGNSTAAVVKVAARAGTATALAPSSAAAAGPRPAWRRL